MKKLIALLLIIMILFTGCSSVIDTGTATPDVTVNEEDLPHVESMSELKAMLNATKGSSFVRWFRDLGMEKVNMLSEADAQSAGADTAEEGSYSQTNTQVSGVDEADRVKTDGKYIYQITDYNKVFITSVDADGRLTVFKEISDFDETFYASTLYMDDDQLIIIGSTYDDNNSYATIYIYDKSDMNNITCVKTIDIKGYCTDSRRIGDSLYLVCNYYPGYYYAKDTELLPCYAENGITTYQAPSDIYYFDNVEEYSAYLILASIDLSDMSKDTNLNTYLGSGQTIYMSENNMYVTYTVYSYYTYAVDYRIGIGSESVDTNEQVTYIHKFKAEGATLTHIALAETTGYPINQFAMDEFNGFFRIAVTDTSKDVSTNNVYIFNENMELTGSIVGMAPGEQIYSVRFNGNTGYMVTYRTVDPLFVMDLTDPANPKIDGELKIPGYSSYMHMYSDTMILGFGMDTQETEDDRALMQGIKIAMFDVSDKANPIQLFTTSIGKRGTYSELNYDHKAFMYCEEKGIFAFPASICADDYCYETQGLVVVKIDMENNRFDILGVLSQDYVENWSNYVQRGLYIGNFLFTVSSNGIYSYNFDTLELIDNVLFD